MDVPRRGLGTLTLALWYVVAMVVHGIPWPFVLGVVAMLASGCEESTLGLLTKDLGTAVAQDAQPADATEFVLDAHLSTDADAQDVDRFDVNPFDVLASDVAPPDASIEDATALDADPRDAGADDAESEDGRPSDVGATDARPSDAETWDAVASDATGLDGSTTPADGGTPPDQACAVGSRTGFRELAIFPDVAACGPRVSYDVAMAAAPISCGVDFHPCSYDDPRLAALAGTPAPFDTLAWLPFEASTCGLSNAVFTNATCSAPVAQSAYLFGAGGCENSGACGQGYRLILWTASWGWSLRLGGEVRCMPNYNHACAYPGGTIAPLAASVTCCRN